MKKKTGIAIAVIVVAAGASAGAWYHFKGSTGAETTSADAVFVDSVGTITGLTGSDGLFSKFSGVVEPQKTEKIEVASGLKVKKAYVSVGDEVQVGTKLFSYDTDDAQDSIAQLEIDIENYEISIKSYNSQVAQLEKERAKVSDDEKLSYTTQIMTTQNSIKRAEYEMKSKQAEMESLKKQIANADVTSPIQGIIKTINNSASGDDNSDTSSGLDSGNEDNSAYMTIMATGEYRIKGKINEQNMSEIQEGMDMIVYSRVDENQTWKGTLTTIDRESNSSNSNSSYGDSDSGDSQTTSSTYPFYVDLDSSDGLMLGQHVYLMADNGQDEQEDGIWLEDYYFITDDEGAVTNYVWAVDANDKLEKREVTLGDFNDETFKYEVLDGLTVDDYIAFPGDDCVEGAPVTRNSDDLYGGDESLDEEDWNVDGMADGDYSDGDYSDGDYSDGDYSDSDYSDGDYSDDGLSGGGVSDISGLGGMEFEDGGSGEEVYE